MKQVTPIHLLRSFEVAARHRSFTLAADELHITQAAVSKQIKALEKELNQKLFNRHAHGVSLTQSGERYWHDMRGLINKLDNITTQLFTERDTATIKIRANISYSDILTEKINWFQKHYPNVAIELTHNVWSKQDQQTNADIEIDYRSIDPKNTDYQLLHQDQIFPVICASIQKQQINSLPLIQILGYYNEWNWWLEQATKSANKIFSSQLQDWIYGNQQNLNALRVDNSLSAYKLAIEGAGIALARSSLVQPYLYKKQLKRIDEKTEFKALEGFHVYLSKTGRVKKACVEFVDFLLNRPAGDVKPNRQHQRL